MIGALTRPCRRKPEFIPNEIIISGIEVFFRDEEYVFIRSFVCEDIEEGPDFAVMVRDGLGVIVNCFEINPQAL